MNDGQTFMGLTAEDVRDAIEARRFIERMHAADAYEAARLAVEIYEAKKSLEAAKAKVAEAEDRLNGLMK